MNNEVDILTTIVILDALREYGIDPHKTGTFCGWVNVVKSLAKQANILSQMDIDYCDALSIIIALQSENILAIANE